MGGIEAQAEESESKNESSIAEKTIVANPLEALRQYVQQEAAQKLVG
jgi:hypothetical protein